MVGWGFARPSIAMNDLIAMAAGKMPLLRVVLVRHERVAVYLQTVGSRQVAFAVGLDNACESAVEEGILWRCCRRAKTKADNVQEYRYHSRQNYDGAVRIEIKPSCLSCF